MNRLQAKLEKIERNPISTAKAVGLRYSVNCSKGYFRIKGKNGFKYKDENGFTISDKDILDRIKQLVLPPAWENVWISCIENGHLQATGIDVKGRKQYRYHADWNKIRNQSKFYRLEKFATYLPLIRSQVEKDLKIKELTYEKVVAIVIELIQMTNIRIGNEAYKKLYGSFGLTTLQNKHVKFDKSKLTFQFIGKKGIKHNINIHSKRLVNLVRKCKEIPGQDLFQYYDDNGNHCTIGSSDVNNYLKNICDYDFTAKDFRVWAGSINAFTAFQDYEKPTNQAETKHTIIEVLDHVASKLGNTRTVCKKYYVHPNVIAAYENGSIWNYKSKSQTDHFSPEEHSLIKLLQNETIAEVIG